MCSKVTFRFLSVLTMTGLLFGLAGSAWAKASVFRGDESHKNLAELAIGGGMADLLAATEKSDDYIVFSTSNYGHTSLNTIANTEVDGFGQLIGIGKKFYVGKGKVFTGSVYYEFGKSESETNTNGVEGEGRGYQRGLGIMGRLDVKSGNYYEWLVHTGKSTNRFSNTLGLAYESEPKFLGGAMTYGHRFALSKIHSLAPYITYFYNHSKHENVQRNNREFDFEDVKSHKIKIGARYMANITRGRVMVRPYLACALDHEFNGKAVIHITDANGTLTPDSPDIKGSTGSFEAGCKWQVKNWDLGVGVECFVAGKRQGWNASLAAICSF